jgi:hypothetical protein
VPARVVQTEKVPQLLFRATSMMSRRGAVVAMTASAADSLGSARTLSRADTPALRTRGSARMAMMTDAVDDRGDLPGRWADIDGLLLRGGAVTGPGFEPGEDVKTVLHDMMHILVVGAGGLGCELLKDLGAQRGGSLASRIVPGRGLARVLSRHGASERAALASVLPRARLAPDLDRPSLARVPPHRATGSFHPRAHRPGTETLSFVADLRPARFLSTRAPPSPPSRQRSPGSRRSTSSTWTRSTSRI